MIGLIILVIIIIFNGYFIKDKITKYIIGVVFILGYISGSLLVENVYDTKIETYDLIQFEDSTLLHVIDNCEYKLYDVNYKNKYFHKDIKSIDFYIDIYYSNNNKLICENKHLKQKIDNIFAWDFFHKKTLSFELSKDKISYNDTKPYIYEMHISKYNQLVRNSDEKEIFTSINFNKEEISIRINKKFYTPSKFSSYILYFSIPKCEINDKKYFFSKNEYRHEINE